MELADEPAGQFPPPVWPKLQRSASESQPMKTPIELGNRAPVCTAVVQQAARDGSEGLKQRALLRPRTYRHFAGAATE